MNKSLPLLIIVVIATQLACCGIFLNDVIADLSETGSFEWNKVSESFAVVALFAGIAFETTYLLRLLQRKAILEGSVGRASSALQDVIESHFAEWKLTAGERDVAALMVKGLSIAEIASVRGSAEGTVKAHLNNIYRKSDARNRAEVLSHIMDSMIDRPLISKHA